MNVVWTPDALRQFEHVDISVAIASERGLVTPTLRAVDTLAIGAIAQRVKDFAQRANAGKLKQDELEGGALSVTNLGMFGTEDFGAIINPPQSAILAVGAAREQPIVVDGRCAHGAAREVHGRSRRPARDQRPAAPAVPEGATPRCLRTAERGKPRPELTRRDVSRGALQESGGRRRPAWRGSRASPCRRAPCRRRLTWRLRSPPEWPCTSAPQRAGHRLALRGGLEERLPDRSEQATLASFST